MATRVQPAHAPPLPSTATLPRAPSPRDDYARARWRRGRDVHHPEYGVGTVLDVLDTSHGSAHSAHAMARVLFRNGKERRRPVSEFRPVLSLSGLLRAAGVPAHRQNAVRANPNLVADVPVCRARGNLIEYFLYRWVPWLQEHYVRQLPPAGETRRDWVSPETAAALRRGFTRTKHNDAIIGAEVGLPRNTIRRVRGGQIPRRLTALRAQRAVEQLLERKLPPTQFVGSSGTAALARVVERTRRLGWSYDAMGLQAGVTGNTLRHIGQENVGPQRHEALRILAALKRLQASAAPLRQLRFRAEDVEALRERFEGIRLDPDMPVIPLHMRALSELLKDARRAGVATRELAILTHLHPTTLRRAHDGQKPPNWSTVKPVLAALASLAPS